MKSRWFPIYLSIFIFFLLLPSSILEVSFSRSLSGNCLVQPRWSWAIVPVFDKDSYSPGDTVIVKYRMTNDGDVALKVEGVAIQFDFQRITDKYWYAECYRVLYPGETKDLCAFQFNLPEKLSVGEHKFWVGLIQKHMYGGSWVNDGLIWSSGYLTINIVESEALEVSNIVTCEQLDENGSPIGVSTVFKINAECIYLYFEYSSADTGTKLGCDLKGPNGQVSHADYIFGGSSGAGHFQLDMPNDYWVPGVYHLNLSYGGRIIYTTTFSVISKANMKKYQDTVTFEYPSNWPIPERGNTTSNGVLYSYLHVQTELEEFMIAWADLTKINRPYSNEGVQQVMESHIEALKGMHPLEVLERGETEVNGHYAVYTIYRYGDRETIDLFFFCYNTMRVYEIIISSTPEIHEKLNATYWDIIGSVICHSGEAAPPPKAGISTGVILAVLAVAGALATLMILRLRKPEDGEMVFYSPEAAYDIYLQLRSGVDLDKLSDSEYEALSSKLRFMDSNGRYWMIDLRDGRWYYFDGNRWVLGTPVGRLRRV